MSKIKYDDTDYLINREESIEYKTSDTNVGSIGEDKERLMKSLNCELDKIMTRSSKVENATEILNLRQPITYMFLNLLEELEQKDKKAKELIKEKQELTSALLDSIPKQKIIDRFEEIQKLYEEKLRQIDLKEVEKIDMKIFKAIKLEVERGLLRELLQESEDK